VDLIPVYIKSTPNDEEPLKYALCFAIFPWQSCAQAGTMDKTYRFSGKKPSHACHFFLIHAGM
jgi:hypothetical protein